MAELPVLHRRHINDTRTVLSVFLRQVDQDGIVQIADLENCTVKFKMVHAESGAVVIAETTVGVTITVLETAAVDYDFTESQVDVPGLYYGYFIVYEAGQSDHFPIYPKQLRIEIYGDAFASTPTYAVLGSGTV